MAFTIDPPVSNVLNDEGDEQTSDHDGSCSSLIFDALDTVIVKEKLGVCEELYPVSGCLTSEHRNSTYMNNGGRNNDACAKLPHGYDDSTVHADVRKT